MILRTTLVSLSAILMAAHFLRWGNLPLTAISLLFPFLLLIHKRWALLSAQALTFAGAAVWANTTYNFVRFRISASEPWIRLAVILGAVILLTFSAALLLSSESVRRRYPRSKAPSG